MNMNWKDELTKILDLGCTDSDVEDFINKHPEVNENIWDFVYEHDAPDCCKGCGYIRYSGMHPCNSCSRRVQTKDYYKPRENCL